MTFGKVSALVIALVGAIAIGVWIGPLASAISEFKPDLDAQREVSRARAEARSDITALGG
jgi:hypothetical protein